MTCPHKVYQLFHVNQYRMWSVEIPLYSYVHIHARVQLFIVFIYIEEFPNSSYGIVETRFII